MAFAVACPACPELIEGSTAEGLSHEKSQATDAKLLKIICPPSNVVVGGAIRN